MLSWPTRRYYNVALYSLCPQRLPILPKNSIPTSSAEDGKGGWGSCTVSDGICGMSATFGADGIMSARGPMSTRSAPALLLLVCGRLPRPSGSYVDAARTSGLDATPRR
jgi:hypothetical protein